MSKIYNLIYEDLKIYKDGSPVYYKDGRPILTTFDLGFYDDEALVQKAIEHYITSPGFCEHREFYKIYTLKVDAKPNEKNMREWIED